MKRTGTYLRLAAFLVVAGFLAVMELTTLTGPHTGDTEEYHAMFASADGVSGLRAGNAVKVAGVPVGKVSDIELVNATTARVTFTANHSQPVTTRTWAVVRYANLLGQRYLALTRPDGPPGTVLPPDGTIPASQTQPALSLTALFNGFRPLFSALTPEQVNELAQDIVDVLQGQTDRVDQLVASTASLTSDLGARSQTFDRVLSSLSTLLTAMAKHDHQLAQTVTTLSALTSALHQDGPAILASLDSVDGLIGSSASLLEQLNDHQFAADVAAAASTTGVLANNTATVQKVVSGFAEAFQRFARVSQNGSWINIYACNIDLVVYGQVSVTAEQILVTGINGLLAPTGGSSPVAGLLEPILKGVGLDKLPAVPVPLTLPGGAVGGSQDNHTAVCR